MSHNSQVHPNLCLHLPGLDTKRDVLRCLYIFIWVNLLIVVRINTIKTYAKIGDYAFFNFDSILIIGVKLESVLESANKNGKAERVFGELEYLHLIIILLEQKQENYSN